MGLDMWFKDDIANVLYGIDLATARMATDRPDVEAAAFREGFRAALEAVEVSFGIAESSRPQARQSQPRLRDVTPTLPRLPGRGNY